MILHTLYEVNNKTLMKKKVCYLTSAYEGDSHISTVHFKLRYKQFSLVTTVHINHFFLL